MVSIRSPLMICCTFVTPYLAVPVARTAFAIALPPLAGLSTHSMTYGVTKWLSRRVTHP